MRTVYLVLVLIALRCFVAHGTLHAQETITFDSNELLEGDSVTNQFEGISIEGAIFALPGFPRVAFGVFGGLFADTVTESPFNGPFLTDEIVDGETTVAGTIEIMFEEPADNVEFWIADISQNGEFFTVIAFDSAEVLLGMEQINVGDPGTGDGVATQVIPPWEGIRRMEIRVDGFNGFSGWGLDTLSFSFKSSILLGDVNQDGTVDLLDVAPFVELITSGLFQAEADINQDGSVDLLDVQPFVELLIG